jgi:non-ribosomal peptide synthetase component E (peptide arylation enzyme)
LKKIHTAGGVSTPDLIHATVGKLGCTYMSGYGGTEGMQTLTRTECDLDRVCRTVGKPTCPYDTYKVIDELGNDLPPYSQGELVVKGPSVFTGYYNMPEENTKVFTADGFFRTGDLAMIDDSGYITLTGRLKDIIKRGGESINAPEIEKLINSHPDVDMVAVVGMPDPDMGEKVCAYIQPKPGADLTFDQIIGYLKDKKASVLQLPERIEFVDNMPLTHTGKLNKRALKEDIVMKLKK